MNRSHLCPLLTLVMIVSLLPMAAYADDYDEGESYTGIKIGFLGSGKVDLPGDDVDQDPSFGAGFFFDFPFGSRLHYGASADLLRMHWVATDDSTEFDEQETMIDIGINVKATIIGPNSSFALRPGVGVGFGALRRMARFSGSNYLTVKAFAEAVYFTPGDLAFLADAGIWYAPSGGDNENDITIGPLVFVRLGIMF